MKGVKVYPRLEKFHIGEILDIDRCRYGQEPFPAALTWAERRPWAYNVLTFQDEVVGYGCVLPVDWFAHNALKKGEMWEDEIPLRHIPLDWGKASAFYIPSIAAFPDTKRLLTSRLVGYTLGRILQSPLEVFGIAISHYGESVVQEVVGMEEQPYSGVFQGIDGFQPRLFVKPAFFD